MWLSWLQGQQQPDSKEVLVGKWQLWWVLVAVGVPMAAERNC